MISLLSGSLNVGDEIKISDQKNEFVQKVDSLQIAHEQVTSIKKGDDAGIKLNQAVKPGSEVFKHS